MKTPKADELLQKHRENKLDSHESALLDSWYIKLATEQDVAVPMEMEKRLSDVWKKLPANTKMRSNRRKIIFRWFSAAVLILALMVGGLYRYRPKLETNIVAGTGKYPNDVLPGGNRAVLTLGDGRRVILDETKTGIVIEQDGIRIIKDTDGSVVCQAIENTADTRNTYNSISTPKAGQYEIKLPDGSRVWLNAQSSLRYPTSFAQDFRKVELTGEAYFEVAKDPAKPFVITSKGQQIQVLGTHFNVNAYENEGLTKTTLLEGVVRLTSEHGEKTLSPGDEADMHSGTFTLGKAQGQQSIAWKTGMFDFGNADIEEIMRQLERWYDLEVHYQGKPSADLFRGTISRNVKLSEVLQILETSGVKFQLNGNRITVYP